jgi:hypothetical protein
LMGTEPELDVLRFVPTNARKAGVADEELSGFREGSAE